MSEPPTARCGLPARAGLLPLLLVAGGALACGRVPDARPNLVLIVLDTARAEMTSAHGWPRPTTPWLEEFADQGVRFERARSTSCWTLPAHASMFSGQLPDVHGADQLSGRLLADLPLLAEVLAEASYQTAGFSRNPWISERSGLRAGFEHFEPLWSAPARGGNPAVRGVRDWLEEGRDDERPFFLFVNLIRPHAPYAPAWRSAREFFADQAQWKEAMERYGARGVRDLFERHYARERPFEDEDWALVRALYEGELRRTDELAQGLVAAVDAATQGEDGRETLVLIVSDHGENLGDHDHASHMFSLDETLTRVVCLARGPGFPAGTRDDRLVQLVDVHPTFLAAAGLDLPPGPGRDLRAPVEPERVVLTRVAWPRTWLTTFTEATLESGALEPYVRALWAAEDTRTKLLVGSDGTELIYDLVADPRAERPLAPDALDPRRLEPLRAAIAASRARRSGLPGEADDAGPSEALDAEALEALRRLGYAR